MKKRLLVLLILMRIAISSFAQNDILPNYTEKILVTEAFQNNVPNQAMDILLGNNTFWGSIEIEVTGSWWYQNTVGKLIKHYSVAIIQGGTIYTNESRVAEASGVVHDNISLGELSWDAANNRFRIPVSHIVSTQNAYTIKIRLFSHGGYSETVNNSLSVSGIYNLQALPKNSVHFTGVVGIGTAKPGLVPNATPGGSNAILEVNGNIRINTMSTIASGEIGNLQFLKAHTATTATTYSTAEIRAFTTSGYDGGLKMYTSQHVGGGNYDLRPVMTLNHVGSVGIGIESPYEKLTLAGNIALTNGANRFIRIGSASNYFYNLQSTNDDFQILEAGDPNKVRFHIAYPTGNIGIGTTSPTEKISVNGNLRAKKVIVSQTGWPDYVFDSSYKIKPLSEVEQFIKNNKRLPEIPSAKQVAEEGISVGDNQALLLKKIEELTLYLIELKKENTDLKKRMDKLENK